MQLIKAFDLTFHIINIPDMRRFYSTLNTKILIKAPSPLPPSEVGPNSLINNMPVLKNPAIARPMIRWQDMPHIRRDRLPEKATDIKGIDSSAHQYFSRKALFGKFPGLFSCKHFNVTFIPASHVIADLRKSNVAYTFTNHGSPHLNNQSLQKALTTYKGEYKYLEFFRGVHSPMGTAVSRGNFRKLIKRALYKSLHEIVPNEPSEVEKISGIFHFRFRHYPCGLDKEDMRANVRIAVKKIYTNRSLRNTLESIARNQNENYPNSRMLAREIRVENMLGAESMSGYYPKLPYLRRERNRRSSR